MKTTNSTICHTLSRLSWLRLFSCLLLSAAVTQGQTTESDVENPRPTETDATSQQLIKNYITVTGGRSAHRGLLNVVAEGEIKEGKTIRQFKLIETADGRRHLTYFWTHLARKHRQIFVYNGQETWMQILGPEIKTAQTFGGAQSSHFSSQFWLMPPFLSPRFSPFIFQYRGPARVNGRPSYAVKGYGEDKHESWFYFDKEESLLTQWGGKGEIGGLAEDMDYRATRFKSVAGVLLPKRIDLLAKGNPFGYIQFDRVEGNVPLNGVSFTMPESTTPVLRQRPVPVD